MTIKRTTITLTVLSATDVDLAFSDLSDIAAEMDEGDCVGSWVITKTELIAGEEEILQACEAVGNDGSFFSDDDDAVWGDGTPCGS